MLLAAISFVVKVWRFVEEEVSVFAGLLSQKTNYDVRMRLAVGVGVLLVKIINAQLTRCQSAAISEPGRVYT